MTPSFDYYYQNPQGSRFLMQSWAYYGLTCSFTMVDPCLRHNRLTMVDHGETIVISCSTMVKPWLNMMVLLPGAKLLFKLRRDY